MSGGCKVQSDEGEDMLLEAAGDEEEEEEEDEDGPPWSGVNADLALQRHEQEDVIGGALRKWNVLGEEEGAELDEDEVMGDAEGQNELYGGELGGERGSDGRNCFSVLQLT